MLVCVLGLGRFGYANLSDMDCLNGTLKSFLWFLISKTSTYRGMETYMCIYDASLPRRVSKHSYSGYAVSDVSYGIPRLRSVL